MNISKTLRIRTVGRKDEIKSLLDSSKKIYTTFGLIFLNTDIQDEDLKIAVLVKKKCGTAVKRNYIKRIIRHFVRENRSLFLNYNRVIFLYRYQGTVNFNLLAKTFINALKIR